MLIRLILIFFVVLFSIQLHSQSNQIDTVYKLSEVNISAGRLNDFSTGLNITIIDSVVIERHRTSSLSKLLAEQTPLYIKSYGQGSLATISFRGTSASQTGFFWNGFAIDPPNIAIVDLSLIPVFFFESIKIQNGGTSSLYGSGNIGGSIHLNNLPVFSKYTGIDAGVSYGSFQKYSTQLKATFSNKNWNSSTGVIFNKQKNDFPFKNNDKIERQKNTALTNFGIIQELSKQFSNKQYLKASIWFQYAHREIPPTLTTANSSAYQVDKSVRSSVYWLKNINNGLLTAKAAYFFDYLNYVDSVYEINSVIKTKKLISEFELKKSFWKNSVVNIGANFTFNNADVQYYNGIKQQNRFAVFLSFQQKIPKINWLSNLNIRQEFIQGYATQLNPSLGFEGKIWKIIYGKINISRNFRAPTLNDRYWQPGGNENLKPEISWNEEASIIFKIKNKSNKLHYSEFVLTAYSSSVDNWIIWHPDSVYSFWTPDNIQKVWARGFEFSGKTKLNFNNLGISLSEGYTYSKSTNQKKISGNDNTYEKQLIYTPLHNFFVQVSFDYRTFNLSYNQNYTGKSYTSRDNKEFVPAYSLGNVSISKNFQFKSCALNLQININNLWNVSYQAIKYMPMPGRSINILLNFKINYYEKNENYTVINYQ